MTMYINRGFARKYSTAPILFANNGAEQFNAAIMHNYSIDGMHFMSDIFVKPGSDICIDIPDKTYHGRIPDNLCNTSQAQVVWCKKSNDNTRFGVGVRFSKSPE